ncbi:IclR family transcriptional regulator [Lysinibacillus sp. KU-BSD001]|uniref:IclR family transcriptional regulator n=1 Tax=Lysinibacillus sp. KU-BSD001 TaxID=3141328 RepID=UPI0036EDC1D1
MENSKTVHRLSTVDNAISLLTLFLKYQSLGLVDIERELQISKTAAFRLAATLTDRGMLLKNTANKTYEPGPIIFQIVNRFHSPDIVSIARPHMEELTAITKESVYLSIRSGNKFIFLSGIESEHALKVTTPLGEEYDLYYGAVGKLHMSYMSPKDLQTYFNRTAYVQHTERTLDIELLKQQLSTIKQNGYAWSLGERADGMIGVAAPIWGKGDEPIAALTILLPLSRFKNENKNEMEALLKEYTAKISQDFLDK